MFYCTNLNESELAMLSGRKVENSGQTYTDFKMEYPLQLEYIAMHPDDPSEYFTMASIGPDRNYYASLKYEEIGSRLAKPALHHHTYYELMFVLSGKVYQIIENQRHLYTPGSCCLLNKNVLHTEEHETDFEVAFLGISDGVLADVYADFTEGFFDVERNRPPTEVDRFLRESLSGSEHYEKKYIDFIPRREDHALDDARLLSILRAISDELRFPRIGSSHLLRSLISKLLYLLSDTAHYEMNPIQIGTEAENILYNQIDRIMHETHGRATRRFLESELHYSGDYLNKITRKYTGFSIHDFGMTICMGEAASQLLTTDLSISDIAAGLGFSNRTHFYKQFDKIYLMSPAEYRKQYRK